MPTLSAPHLTPPGEATAAPISATSPNRASPAATFVDKILRSAADDFSASGLACRFADGFNSIFGVLHLGRPGLRLLAKLMLSIAVASSLGGALALFAPAAHAQWHKGGGTLA